MNMNMDFRVLKYKHIDNKWYALYEMTKEMWCVVVYDNSESEILFSCIELEYNMAIKKYNLVRHNPLQYLD